MKKISLSNWSKDEEKFHKERLELFLKNYQSSVIAIEEIPFTQIERYGVISGDLIDGTNDTYRVTNMFEKPKSHDLIEFKKDSVNPNSAPSFMAIVGRYILTPDIFDILNKTKPDKNGEIQITEALLSQTRKGKVIAYKFKGNRFDCGNIKGYVDATNHFASKQGI